MQAGLQVEDEKNLTENAQRNRILRIFVSFFEMTERYIRQNEWFEKTKSYENFSN